MTIMAITYEIAEGWRAIRHPGEGAGLDELELQTQEPDGEWTHVWQMEIPPKMPDEELISQAAMLATMWDKAYDRGVDWARRAVLCALDNADLLGGAAG